MQTSIRAGRVVHFGEESQQGRCKSKESGIGGRIHHDRSPFRDDETTAPTPISRHSSANARPHGAPGTSCRHPWTGDPSHVKPTIFLPGVHFWKFSAGDPVREPIGIEAEPVENDKKRKFQAAKEAPELGGRQSPSARRKLMESTAAVDDLNCYLGAEVRPPLGDGLYQHRFHS